MYNDPNQPQPPPYGQQPYQQQPTQNSQPPYGQPDQQYGPPYGQPQYGVPPVPNYAQPQQQKKGSLRWLWITLGIILGLVVLVCGGCVIASALGVGFLAKTVAAPITTVDQYYGAIKAQDYTKAYSYLDSNATLAAQGPSIPVTSVDTFTVAARAVDTSAGPVSSYNIVNTSVNNSTATITVHVTRGGQSYDVHLQLRDVGNGNWKIVNGDGI